MKKKKKKRKGNAIRSRNISDGFYHTCIKNTGRNSWKINICALRIKNVDFYKSKWELVTFNVILANPSGVFWYSCQ